MSHHSSMHAASLQQWIIYKEQRVAGPVAQYKHSSALRFLLNTSSLLYQCHPRKGVVALQGHAHPHSCTHLHKLAIHAWSDLIELAHHSMLGDVNHNLCQKDLPALPQELPAWQPLPAVVHFLHLKASTHFHTLGFHAQPGPRSVSNPRVPC